MSTTLVNSQFSMFVLDYSLKYLVVLRSLTKPEFVRQVAKSFLVAGPVTPEVNGAVLSSLEHLHVTTNTYT